MRNSQDGTLLEWAELLKAVRENQGDLGGLEPYAEALSGAYTRTLTNKALRDSLRESSMYATARLLESLEDGCEAAAKLRAYIRSQLGFGDEKLRLYGLSPSASRKRRRPSGGAAGV